MTLFPVVLTSLAETVNHLIKRLRRKHAPQWQPGAGAIFQRRLRTNLRRRSA